MYEKLNWMLFSTAQVSHQICQFFFGQFFVSSCRVTMVDKNKAVACCLLATSAILLFENKNRKSLKCGVRSGSWKGIYHAMVAPLLFILECWVPWDVIVVSAGKLRKLWDSLSELRSSVCERRLERTVLRPTLLTVCCILRGPDGNVSWMLFQEGRSSNLRLRRGVGQAAHTLNNPYIKCPGVYCAQTVNNADTNELYWVQLSGSWVSSLTLTLIVQLPSKLLVTVRDTSADCTWNTRQLHIARAINIKRDHI